MSNLRFCVDNKAILSTTTIKNGQGAGAPAREETTPFTMEKALQHDRLTPYVSQTTPTSPFNFDVDLGSSLSIDTVGIHGLEHSSTSQITQVEVYSQNAYANPPDAGFGLRATLAVGSAKPRDIGAVISAQVHRYWRFRFVFTGGGTVGKFKVGKLVLGPMLDLGYRQSGPFGDEPSRYRTEGGRSGGGQPIIHDLGLKSRRYVVPLTSVITDARRTAVEALVSQARTFTIIDQDDRFAEVFLVGGRMAFNRTWPNIAQGSEGFTLETLG